MQELQASFSFLHYSHIYINRIRPPVTPMLIIVAHYITLQECRLS